MSYDRLIIVYNHFERMKCMQVTYKKLWKVLIDRKLTASDIRRQTDLSSCTMSKLRHDEPVSITVLLKIASVLNCDISDICEFEKNELEC